MSFHAAGEIVFMLLSLPAPRGYAGLALHAAFDAFTHHFITSAYMYATRKCAMFAECADMNTSPQDRSGGLSDRPGAPPERPSRRISIGIDM